MLKKAYVKSRKAWKVSFALPKDEWPRDMQVEGVELAGDFNHWHPSESPMTSDMDSYRLTLELPAGHEYQFRYLINGSRWYNEWHADAYVHNEFGEDNCIVSLPKV